MTQGCIESVRELPEFRSLNFTIKADITNIQQENKIVTVKATA